MPKLIIIALLFSVALYSNPSFSLALTVNVAKVKTTDKKIIMALYSLPKTPYQPWSKLPLIEKKIIDLGANNQDVTFPSLPSGTYAIRLFQDLNNNEILDRSASDIPLEPVGFSQNPSLFGGEPTPEDSAITLTQDENITINLKHRKPKKKRKSNQ